MTSPCKWSSFGLALAFASLVSALEVSAQGGTRASGVSAGSFTVMPSVALQWLNDGNVYHVNDEQDVLSDMMLSVKPEMRVASDWSRHELRASAVADMRRFADLSSEDTTNLSGDLAGRLGVATNLEIDAGVAIAQLHEPRGDPDTPRSITEPVAYSSWRHHIGTAWHPGRLHLKLALDEHNLRFDDGRSADGELILQQDRDRIERDWTLETALDVSDVRMFLRLARYQRSYENLTRGFNRDGTGNGRMVGLTYRASGLLALEAFYGQRTYELADARLRDADGPVYGLVMDYRPSSFTMIGMRAERSIEETALVRASAFTRRAMQIDLTHQLTPAIVVHGQFGTEHRDYLGIDREYDHRFWSVEAEWQATRSLALGMGYSNQDRDALPAFDEYARSVPFLRLRWAP